MGDSWRKCPDCLALLQREGVRRVVVCDICTHLFSNKTRCACESEEEKHGEKN